MTTDATLPAAVPLRLPPRSAYATPSSKSSKSTQRLKSSLTYYPIRPFAPLHVCMEDLTADIFHAAADVSATLACGGDSPSQLRMPLHCSTSFATREGATSHSVRPCAASCT